MEEILKQLKDIENKIDANNKKLSDLKQDFEAHRHTGTDGKRVNVFWTSIKGLDFSGVSDVNEGNTDLSGDYPTANSRIKQLATEFNDLRDQLIQ